LRGDWTVKYSSVDGSETTTMTDPGRPIDDALADGEGRSARKRRAILDAAATTFLRNGYLGTSMDEIAAVAAVSKQTVYKQFGDKERLFSEIVLSTIHEHTDPFFVEIGGLQDTGDVKKDLRRLARRLLTMLMQPRLLQLRRLVIGEAGRFPQLGRTFSEQGPERAVSALASAFERLAARGRLQVDDPVVAAQHFNWLVVSIPLNAAMLSGDDEPFSAAELKQYADAGVRVFLAAYGRR
jgi:TetR/AcrR family transcriptional regulator, mexJK operon transcriptional repressor